MTMEWRAGLARSCVFHSKGVASEHDHCITVSRNDGAHRGAPRNDGPQIKIILVEQKFLNRSAVFDSHVPVNPEYALGHCLAPIGKLQSYTACMGTYIFSGQCVRTFSLHFIVKLFIR